MDSTDALDLLSEVHTILRTGKTATLELLDRIKEQILRHRRALRGVIGTEKLIEDQT